MLDQEIFGQGDAGRPVFLALMNCDDQAAIARLREILPETVIFEADDLAIRRIRSAGAPDHTGTSQPQLTGRQRQILPFLHQGLSNKEIGRRLGLSHFTVRNHVSKLLQLTGARSRKDLEAQ